MSKAPLAALTLVLGGARSGKSRQAEALIMQMTPPWIYIATAQAFDDEMRVRIAHHRARRGENWQTVEAPLDLAGALRGAQRANGAVLIDCLTLWLSNLLLAGRDLDREVAALDAALNEAAAPIVLVSNEVGLGIVPETPLGRRFRDEAGRLHQHLAERAGRVLFMVAGLPITVK